jgi:site-specific DNA-adenine methylase
MQYWGGKAKTGKDIAQVILSDPRVQTGQYPMYWEPFCGMLGVLRHILAHPYSPFQVHMATDLNPAIHHFWMNVQGDWQPDVKVTPAQYKVLRETKDSYSSQHVFVGHSCGFGGKYFDLANCTQAYLDKRLKASAKTVAQIHSTALFSEVLFDSRDFLDIPDSTHGCVFYLDPPYHGTSKGNGYPGMFDQFDTQRFWSKVRQLTAGDKNIIFISEVMAPNWATIVWQPLSRPSYARTEYLYSVFDHNGTIGSDGKVAVVHEPGVEDTGSSDGTGELELDDNGSDPVTGGSTGQEST